MFTGIVQETGKLMQIRPHGGGVQLIVDAPVVVAEASVGDSIACNGVCLTVEKIKSSSFEAHAGTETMRRTTLGTWRQSTALNVEPALRPTDRMGGHIMQGHVDCVGTCTDVHADGETTFFSFELPHEHMLHVVEKGSIAIDGISLTVVDLTPAGFSVAIIPHTIANTTLPHLRSGDTVNIETDVLAKYIQRMLEGAGHIPGQRINEQFLRDNGFMS